MVLLAILISPKSALAGNLSYSAYLFHPIVLGLVFQVMAGRDPAVQGEGDLIYVGCALVTTAALKLCQEVTFAVPQVRSLWSRLGNCF